MSAELRRVALVNTWSDQNRGDAAIVLATRDAVRLVAPSAVVGLHTVAFGARDLPRRQAEHFQTFAEEGLRVYPAMFPALTGGPLPRQLRRSARLLHTVRALALVAVAAWDVRAARWLLRPSERPAYDALIESDLIVGKGGTYLLANSWKDAPQLIMVMLPLLLAHAARRRTVLLGVSVGPARSRLGRLILRLCLASVDCIVVRETYALRTCHALRVSRRKVMLLPDLALLPIVLEHLPPPKPAAFIGFDQPLVGVTVRGWAFDDLDDVSDSADREYRYLHAVASALKRFAGETGSRIVLVPQVTGPNVEGSDLPALDTLEDLLDECDVLRFRTPMTTAELRSVYGNLDLLLATRLHSAILGFGTPTVIIGYGGDKSIGTAELLGLSDSYIHINDVTSDEIFARLRRSWALRHEIREGARGIAQQFASQFLADLPLILHGPLDEHEVQAMTRS